MDETRDKLAQAMRLLMEAMEAADVPVLESVVHYKGRKYKLIVEEMPK